MWSVWSETTEVYLGHGIAMLKTGRKPSIAIHHPVTLPWERVLAKLSNEAGQPVAKGSRLKVSLSGLGCPAFGVAIPEGVTRWHEQQQIALASAAQGMGAQPDQIACATDVGLPSVAAALPLPILDELKHWALQIGCKLVSVGPLWALATQCQLSRQSTTQCLLVQEPGCVTLLADTGKSGFKATTLPGDIHSATVQTAMHQWLLNHQLNNTQLVSISFDSHSRAAAAPQTSEASPSTNKSAPGLPNRWEGHWYTAS